MAAATHMIYFFDSNDEAARIQTQEWTTEVDDLKDLDAVIREWNDYKSSETLELVLCNPLDLPEADLDEEIFAPNHDDWDNFRMSNWRADQ